MLGTAAYGLGSELTRPRLRSTWPFALVLYLKTFVLTATAVSGLSLKTPSTPSL
jgi:hypothetical protein